MEEVSIKLSFEKETKDMETVMHYPFIYFLYDHNQVVVYTIQTLDSITLANVVENGEWERYELPPSEPFTTFRHEQSDPKEGWSFWAAAEHLSYLVDTINDYIQLQRNRMTTTARVAHIVCSESAAGSLRVELAPPKYVIGFPEDLSIGPLWKLDEERGQAFRQKWLMENINDEMDDFVGPTKIRDAIREIRDIPSHLPIYIWCGDHIEEQCGLRFFLYVLRDQHNEIFLIHSNGQQVIERQWNPNLYDIKRLSVKGRQKFLQQWEGLAESTAVLRQWEHQHIQEVPENFYDSFIVKKLKEMHQEQGHVDFIQTGTFLLELLASMEKQPNIFYLEYRIRYLVYNGTLVLKGIPKSMRHYYVKLRQKTSLV